MKKLVLFTIITVACWGGAASAQVVATPTATATPLCSTCGPINDMGVAGVPVAVSACGSGSTQVIFGSKQNTTWTVLCEADSRCELGTSSNTAPVIAPTATIGFLFKANAYVNEASIGIGSAVGTLRMDCCGVAGATSCDSWRE